MKTYQQKLMDYLEVDGWDILKIETEDLERWADEIWYLESNWSPKGKKGYITFLVDPMHDGLRKQGQAVWGLGCSKQYPTSRQEAESITTISFSKSFKDNMLDFQLEMESLRE
ncbi:hypothetical protein [Kangiella sp. HZ709]|uniref:hypothetical protein n=1 Tax=Kangiella sp. HZ709 TaxID=2666328 RepID=UPI0012AFCC86|nr:hypothetical protein [Kangiella sp. HZ709]MRX28171.1 hypothetical protein [Kangiella sp. HZ709]